MVALENDTLDRAKLGTSITAWGKKKGGLISQEMSDEADTVAIFAKRMSNLCTFIDTVEVFETSRIVANANKVLVAKDLLDSTVSDKLPEATHVILSVSQAVVDANGGNLLSALQRLQNIRTIDGRETELTSFWKRHYNKLLSKYDARVAGPAVLRMLNVVAIAFARDSCIIALRDFSHASCTL